MSTTLISPRDDVPAIQPADLLPPGERYFRHPGDVVRLILWGLAALLLAIARSTRSATTGGLTDDLGSVADHLGLPVRQLSLALVQLASVALPMIIVVGLVIRQRWRRLAMVVMAAAAGAATWAVLDTLLGHLPHTVVTESWLVSARFPSPAYLAGAAAVAMVGKPWLARSWRRAVDIALIVLVAVMAVTGTAGVPALLLAVAAGAAVGAALLVGIGAPNRRPAPMTVAAALSRAGMPVTGLRLERAQGGRAQLYVADAGDRGPVFIKVYGRDSRDADLLYGGYRALMVRGPNDDWPSLSLKHDVEHEAYLLLLARQAGVTCPTVEVVSMLPDGSMAIAMERVEGQVLDTLAPDDISDDLLDATWREVRVMHTNRLAHRTLRTANILVQDQHPVIIDLGFGEESATPRMQAVDRAELLSSMAVLVGPGRSVASAARTIAPRELAATIPYLQPLALSAATRRQASKSLLAELRRGVSEAAAVQPPPLERLIRVRPRTLVMIAVLVGAFYLLLPQLANVDDSFKALRAASLGWLAVAVVVSGMTYVASAIGIVGGVRTSLPLGQTIQSQVASSFVNRVTPANVGGMALNVRFMQKAGVPPAEAITGVAINSIAGAIVHMVLLVVFFAWAGHGGGTAFAIPSSSKLLVVLAVLFALAGVVGVTTRGRRLVRTHVLVHVKQSWASVVSVARSPAKLAVLFAGSLGVTLAYIGALFASVAAVHGDLSIAQVGAVYLGASLLAAAAPTPGGLGALEAALVAGLTGVGMEPGAAVAAVLSYRLVTYWLPILPGWFAFHMLERRDLI